MDNAPAETTKAPAVSIAPGPHIGGRSFTTRRMMLDVLLALLPVAVASFLVFRERALLQMAIGVASALAAEAVFSSMRGRRPTLGDGSAAVTGLILALSLPATAPWYVGFVGALSGIGLGKAVFGGLGQNIFNPAMVGRAFVMMAFPQAMAAGGYIDAQAGVDALTLATPLTALQMGGAVADLRALFLGTTNGSVGETSALACLVGGAYLCLRRTASWQIPAGVVAAVAAVAGLGRLFGPGGAWTVGHEICSGALLFGAFYIATDPVTSPLTPRGKWIFGVGTGLLVMLIRKLSSYPEGVMFSVLVMNALVPLINRWTIPVPVGGPVPERKRPA
jgi:electron transport complex protein RnfD